MAFKEEVKAFETSGAACFDFDWYDMGFHRQEKIDFGLAIEGFANPEGEFGFLIGRGGGEEFLSNELLGGGTTVDATRVSSSAVTSDWFAGVPLAHPVWPR